MPATNAGTAAILDPVPAPSLGAPSIAEEKEAENGRGSAIMGFGSLGISAFFSVGIRSENDGYLAWIIFVCGLFAIPAFVAAVALFEAGRRAAARAMDRRGTIMSQAGYVAAVLLLLATLVYY